MQVCGVLWSKAFPQVIIRLLHKRSTIVYLTSSLRKFLQNSPLTITTKVKNSNNKSFLKWLSRSFLVSIRLKFLPQILDVNSVILSHILYMCEALIWLCFGGQNKISFIYDLSSHRQVFSLGEESGQIGICGPRPIDIGIYAATGQEQIRLFPLKHFMLQDVWQAQIKDYLKTQALSNVQHSVDTKRPNEMPTSRDNVLIVSSAIIYFQRHGWFYQTTSLCWGRSAVSSEHRE